MDESEVASDQGTPKHSSLLSNPPHSPPPPHKGGSGGQVGEREVTSDQGTPEIPAATAHHLTVS